MQIFILGAVTGTSEYQLAKFDVYKKISHNIFNNYQVIDYRDILDYKKELPLSFSDFEINKEMAKFDLEQVKNSNLLIADISSLSTGLGIELGTALAYKKQIIFCYEKNSKISTMITGTFYNSPFIEYEDIKDLESQLSKELKKWKDLKS